MSHIFINYTFLLFEAFFKYLLFLIFLTANYSALHAINFSDKINSKT